MFQDQVNYIISKLHTSNGKLETYRDRKKFSKPWKDCVNDLQHAVAFLKTHQLQRGDHIGIIATNSYEWIMLDLACIAMGYTLIPFDPTVEHSTNERIQTFRLKLILSNLVKYIGNSKVYTLDEMLTHQGNDPVIPVQYEPTDELTWKFTSGTTQRPKAIAAMKQSVDAALSFVQDLFHHDAADRLLVFLPLHTYQQRYWIYSSILFEHDLLLVPKEYVFHSLQADQPTVIMGVPFFFETLQKNFLADLAEEAPISVEEKRERFLETLGGKIRYCWTGSAPISADTLAFYEEMQIPLYQGYGMNEVCIVSKNYPGQNKTGSAGKLLPGKSILFDQHHQLLVKSDYPVNTKYCYASEEDNLLTFLPDGYVATGDLGYIDEDGYLFINGRIKELIVLANAIKVHPAPIEKKMEQSPMIRHCVVYGDEHPYLVALVVPSSEQLEEQQLKEAIAGINEQLLPHERICKVFVCNQDFTYENNRLSAQNKLLRKKVLDEFRQTLENLYN